jgi:S1-C subfamily serine protease
VIPYLIQDGKYRHAWLGIAGTTLVPTQIQAMKLPSDLRGVMVTDISDQGPSGQAGLQGTTQAINTPFGPLPINGDIITAINGTPVTQMDDLIAYLDENTQPGDKVTLSVWRSGASIELSVTLQERPDLSS